VAVIDEDDVVGFRDVLRHRAAKRPHRYEPSLVVPAGVGREIEAHVRGWSPDAWRLDGTVIDLGYGLRLLGPFDRTDPHWPDPQVPARFEVSYVTRAERPAGSAEDWILDARYGLLAGLGRRTRGLTRERAGKPWTDPGEQPAGPIVLANRRLSPEEAVALVSQHYPGVVVGYRDEATYELYTDGLVLEAELTHASVFPLLRLQHWYTGARDLTQYTLVYDTTPEELRRMADAARTIARATDGLVLDEDGFPWRDV
jgi:hypothetical protein